MFFRFVCLQTVGTGVPDRPQHFRGGFFGVPAKAFFRDIFRLQRAFRETPLPTKKPFVGCFSRGPQKCASILGVLLFFSVPAVGTEFAFGQADSFYNTFKGLEIERREFKLLANSAS